MRTVIQRKAVHACVRAFCAALALFALLMACARAETDGMLRVKLARLGAPAALTMRANCDYTLASDATVRIPSGTELTVSATGDSLTLTAGKRSLNLGPSACLKREGSGSQGLSFASPALSNRFCGDLVLAASGDAVTAMLSIYIEDYLYGVVGYEMSPSSDIEALKAQAIVARNYALRQKRARSGAGYDLSDSGDALSFRGYNDAGKYAAARQAVDETRGQVLFYGDEPATCYFCDSNGGQTESSANVLGEALPYSAVMDDPYDLEGGGAKKSATLRDDGSDLNDALRAALLAGMADQLREQGLYADSDATRISAIQSIEPESPRYDAPSRLYRALAFTLSVSGETLLGEPATARGVVRIPTYGALEQWYDLGINDADNETVWVTHSGQSFEITFRRSGSGLGMSQRGAQAMALKGLDCETILDYYYPGTRLRALKLDDSADRSASEPVNPAADAQPIATARLKQKSRLYDSADDSDAAKTTLPAGVTVAVYAVRGEWAAIGSGKLYGFVHADALASFALTGVTAAQVRNETFVQISGGDVNMLQLPVKEALVIDTLPDGTLVRLNAYTDQWALVTATSGTEGFIPRASLTLQANGPAPDGSRSDDIVVAQDNLYGLLTRQAGLYVNADDSVDPVLTLEKDAHVRILAYNSQWANVCTDDGQTGFVKLQALSAVQELSPAEDAATDGGEVVKVQEKRFCYVSVEALSVFRRYSVDSDILATLKQGQKVRLRAYNDKWAYVSARGVKGFVLRSGLSETAPAEAEGAIEGGRIKRVKGRQYATVNTDDAPLYPSWSEADAPITHLARGTQVQLGAYNEKWACVNADGTMGFMRVDALTLSEAQTADSEIKYQECEASAIEDTPVYDNARLAGEAIATVPGGGSVHVYAYTRECAYVEYGGLRGYVSMQRLKRSD